MTYEEALAERLLEDFLLEEILEMNDVTEEEALVALIKGGRIGFPEGVVAEVEELYERQTEFDF